VRCSGSDVAVDGLGHEFGGKALGYCLADARACAYDCDDGLVGMLVLRSATYIPKVPRPASINITDVPRALRVRTRYGR